ncbi:MAG: type VI secretion system tip protein TssI/VgrG [Myxococcota bacterium]
MHGPIPSSTPTSLVRYTVHIDTAVHRGHDLHIYADDPWRVRSLELDESVDRPYTLDLHLITPDTELEVDALLGAALTLSCQRDDDDARLVHGLVQRAWYIGTFDDHLHARLEVGPALAQLGLGRRSRVFQAKTAVEIVQQVVAETFEHHGRALDVSRLTRVYDELDYCVQFKESDLDFMARLLAREGIGYFFEHHEAAETMVLFDHSPSLRGVSLYPEPYDDTPPPIVCVSTSQAELADTETIVRLEWQRSARPRRTEISAWDWQSWEPARPCGRADDEDPATTTTTAAVGEHYEHAPRRLPEKDGRGPHLDYTARAAEDLHDHRTARSQIALGRGNVLAFGPGQRFELEGHPHPTLDGDYVLLRVVHRADCPEAELDPSGRFAGPNYDNRFECIPAQQRWRPAPRPRPDVHGHLLATVVGPPGESIHTDEHGRIKVWIHWDRQHGPRDEDASCWLRVAQPWAGPGWGMQFIPRVGMEVLISFVDGDPDRPLCVGCVYNGRNRPPYSLPEERTKSTIKTQSTPHAEGFNELRFEDAAGREEIFVHAQRDLHEVVRHGHRRQVGHEESIDVGTDRAIAVGGSHEMSIEGCHHVAVHGRAPDGRSAPSPHHSVEVDGDSVLTAAGTIRLWAQRSITLQVQSTTLTLTPHGLVLRAGAGASASLDTVATVSSTPGSPVLLNGQPWTP